MGAETRELMDNKGMSALVYQASHNLSGTVHYAMRASEVLRRMFKLQCTKVRQKGSHLRIACPCGRHSTTVPVHKGEDLGPGLLRAIERDLEPCLGKGWLR